MTDRAPQVEFFFDPTCPYAWITSRWVVEVARRRPLRVRWRPLALRLLNEPLGYAHRPVGYREAHDRGLEMLRIVHTARFEHGEDAVGALYTAFGEELWNGPPPAETSFGALLEDRGRRRDLATLVAAAGLPPALAAAAWHADHDEVLRRETFEGVDRAGGGVGTPVLTFDPPDGPSVFGPVIDAVPDGEDVLRLWDAAVVLAAHGGFAELKRAARLYPQTPKTARVAGQTADRDGVQPDRSCSAARTNSSTSDTVRMF